MEKLKIYYIKVTDLKQYEKNARRHSDEDIAAIVRSIEEFGFDDPVGVWGDQNIIVEGHGRVEAAKKLGIETVPCIRLDHLTEEQRKAYAIAHNKTAELSEWDRLVLGEELRSLDGIFDMTDFGFGDFELTLLTHPEDMKPDGFSAFEESDNIGEYDSTEKNHLAKERIIITYTEEEEDIVKKMLGIEEIDRVVYDINDLKKNE